MPCWDDVREALLWALEHDLPALTEHRSAVHHLPYGWSRRDADEQLVTRWRESVSDALDAGSRSASASGECLWGRG